MRGNPDCRIFYMMIIMFSEKVPTFISNRVW